MSNNVPVLMLRGANGKFFPVAGITGTGGGGGGTGGASTANVSYTNTQLPNVKNVKTALDELIPDSHNHNNKNILDKFSESDGKPTYDGQAIGGGGGASDFIIKMTVEANDGNYTVTSCDATVEQIDAAVADEKRVVVVASFYGTILELPMLQRAQGVMYSFGMFLNGQMITSFVQKIDGGTSEWQFLMTQIEAVSVSYSNDALPNVDNVGGALNALVPNSHTHANKAVLDKLSVSNGKLQYNGSDVGLKGDKGDKGDPGSDANVTKDNVVAALGYTPEAVSAQVYSGSNITLADNTEYRLTSVTTLNLTYPTGRFECWMRLTFAASGDATVILPTGTKYIGTTPDFKNGETWEMSIKDGVVIAQKVGDGSMTPIETVEDGTEVSY